MNPKLYCFACMHRLETEEQRCPRCGHDNRVRLNGKGQLPFSIIKNRYLIGKALGRGGFGVTYMGLDLSLDRRVAIKEYFPSELVSRETGQSQLAPYDENSRQSFEQGRERSMEEARTIARLNDVPAAVNVYDVFLANDTLYIVMEYIEGETLRARVKAAGGKLSAAAALTLLRPVFGALSQIHRQGILHRDVSPDNIMLRASTGSAVLLDFGAAHNMELETESEHSTSLRPGYAPVEQYSRTGLQDARTDEYALCATIYFAITGQKPVAAMERAFGEAPLPLPSALGADISPALEAVLMKGLSVQAKDRFPDIATLEAAMDAALTGAVPPQPPTPPTPPVPPISGPSGSGQSGGGSGETGPGKSPKPKKPLGLIVAAGVTACAMLAVLLMLLKPAALPPAATPTPAESATPTATAAVSPNVNLAPTATATVTATATATTTAMTTATATSTVTATAVATVTATAKSGVAPTPGWSYTDAPTATALPGVTATPASMTTPSPAPTAGYYVGYAVTIRETALRDNISLDEQSAVVMLPSNTLLLVDAQVDDFDGIVWNDAQTVLGDITVGFVQDNALLRITDEEAQLFVNAYQNGLPAPSLAHTPAPTHTPTPAPTAKPTVKPTAKPSAKATKVPIGMQTVYDSMPWCPDTGNPVYESDDGWLYSEIWVSTGEIYLCGLSSTNTLEDPETLVIPSEVDGYKVTSLYRKFSQYVSDSHSIRHIVLPDTLEQLYAPCFSEFDCLETVTGGTSVQSFHLFSGYADDSPFYQNGIVNNLILGDNILVHGVLDGAKSSLATRESGAITVPEGIRVIDSNAFRFANGVDCNCPVTTLTLPSSLRELKDESLKGFTGTSLTIPDNVQVGYTLFDYKHMLTDLWVGKNVTFKYSSKLTESTNISFKGTFYSLKFTGTLHLADGATLPTLIGLFGTDCKYTVDCEKGAILDGKTPKGVKIKYRK